MRKAKGSEHDQPDRMKRCTDPDCQDPDKQMTAACFTWDNHRSHFKPRCKNCLARTAMANRRAAGVPARTCMSHEDRRKCQNESDRRRREETKRRAVYEPATSLKPCTNQACPDFGVPKPRSEFWVDRGNTDGYAFRCKRCSRPIARRNGQLWREKNWIRQLLNEARGSRRGCDIDEAYIQNLFDQQGGLCHWVRVPMVPSTLHRYPWAPSLDRLDCNPGYAMGNLVLSSRFANFARNSTDRAIFAKFCQLLKPALDGVDCRLEVERLALGGAVDDDKCDNPPIRSYTAEFRAAVLAGLNAGRTQREIALEFKVSRMTIMRWWKRSQGGASATVAEAKARA